MSDLKLDYNMKVYNMKDFIYVVIAGLIVASLLTCGGYLLHIGNPLGFIPYAVLGAIYMWVYLHK